jgi:F-type H+-transporting ATPase subunit delta
MADIGTIARPYARALFDLANANGELARWSDALHAAAALVNDPSAKRVFSLPDLSEQKRVALALGVFEALPTGKPWLSPQGTNLLTLLVENDRLAALPEIAVQFDALKYEAENKVKAKLVSAVAVDRAIADKVVTALEKKLGRKVELELEVDPTLIGGAVIRAEDLVIDGSLRTQLQRLGESLVS